MSIHLSIIMGNDTFGKGGGILNEDGKVKIIQCDISDNSSSFGGGGISNCGIEDGSGGKVKVFKSTISNNIGAYGGGILNCGAVVLCGSTVIQNTAYESGGGIFNDGGVVALIKTDILDNVPDACVGCYGFESGLTN